MIGVTIAVPVHFYYQIKIPVLKQTSNLYLGILRNPFCWYEDIMYWVSVIPLASTSGLSAISLNVGAYSAETIRAAILFHQ